MLLSDSLFGKAISFRKVMHDDWESSVNFPAYLVLPGSVGWLMIAIHEVRGIL